MSRDRVAPCAVLLLGLWNGASVCRGGGLLYRSILDLARRYRIRGGTVWTHIEGKGGGKVFRTVENEVASNELPLWMEFVDDDETLTGWLPVVLERLGQEGVCAMERGHAWWLGGAAKCARTTAERPARRTGPLPEVPGLQVRLYTREDVFIHGKPVYQAVAEWMRARGILWVATTRAVTGYGGDGPMRAASVFPFRQDAPIMMTIVDERDRLSTLLPEFTDWLGDAALVVASDVTLYSGSAR